MTEDTPLTVVCLASRVNGLDFIRQCKDRGCRVILITEARLAEEWPAELVDRLVAVPDQTTADQFEHAVTEVAHTEKVHRVAALDENDVMRAALVREYLRVPGMGTTAARLFRDKLTLRGQARDAEIRVPDFIHVFNREELRSFMEDVRPPWLLKPRSDISGGRIQKLQDPFSVWRAIDTLDARAALTERSSYYLLERFVPGDVYHVDSLVQNGEVVFAAVNRYRRPPLDVAAQPSVFITATATYGSPVAKELLAANSTLLRTLGFVRGATHADFVKGRDGKLYFLDVAAHAAGSFIPEMIEAATGVNLWREWANVELAHDHTEYTVPPARTEYAGLVLAPARQETPDTSGFKDSEIVLRIEQKNLVGLIVRSPQEEKVQSLLASYVTPITARFLAGRATFGAHR